VPVSEKEKKKNKKFHFGGHNVANRNFTRRTFEPKGTPKGLELSWPSPKQAGPGMSVILNWVVWPKQVIGRWGGHNSYSDEGMSKEKVPLTYSSRKDQKQSHKEKVCKVVPYFKQG